MSTLQPFQNYGGEGVPLAERGGRGVPLFEPPGGLSDPKLYVAEPGLRDAVNVALALGQPLVLAGEPGTGKTQLAGSVAYELGLPAPLEFHAKTSSVARDLFYRYDSLRHFHDSHFRQGILRTEDYITFEALGLAILLAGDPAAANPFLLPEWRNRGPLCSVVLIDEIDKAPRDLPNDILNEIERMSFTVLETGHTCTADPAYRPFLILTSNSEKNLPDAFLRRCVFYYIDFSGGDRLREIVLRRLRPGADFTSQMLDHALAHFEEIRSLNLRKLPATAELLARMRVLMRGGIDVDHLKPGQAEALAYSYAFLAKSREDQKQLQASARVAIPG